MRKIIAAINMTLDGDCDHRAGVPDEEVHDHYTQLMQEGDAILYGRITYDLMRFWQTLLKEPSGEKSMDDFARAIDKIQKIVFTRTLDHVSWDSARIAQRELKEEVLALKQETGKPIFVGSRSLIIQLMKLGLVDELQLCIQPVISGGTLPLFENLKDRMILKLIRTKTFRGGAVILYYEPSFAAG